MAPPHGHQRGKSGINEEIPHPVGVQQWGVTMIKVRRRLIKAIKKSFFSSQDDDRCYENINSNN